MMKRPRPSWPWWLLGGSNRKEKETEVVKFPRKIVKGKRKELEVESFGSSGSESVVVGCGGGGDGPEWSVGWTEPHGPDFQSDDDGGFLVLVPCYRAVVEGSSNNQLLSAVKNLPNGLSPDGKNYMEQWLSSLQNL
ncbi:hypothetical protein AALP_AA7G257600 [Arabis alpina]|uniref:Uncharacterized protein n=1 Tax=Arabis alpina TaxID=50452 RepID=A0A087GKL1_ARAAL|nr:hypothetical protein AALP_AA7G257600 [Arabis alpina]